MPAAARAEHLRAVSGGPPDDSGPLMLADAERVDAALAVMTRLRRAGAQTDLHGAALDDSWHDWMEPTERHLVLSLSVLDWWAIAAVADAEMLAMEALARICREPDVAAELERRKPWQGEP